MALFPKAQESATFDDAPRRMRWTREMGTRKLLIGLIALFAIWFIVGKIQDHFLLAKQWPPLQPVPEGLTVVGALNPRGNYDRNLFKILNENATSRVVLTEFGWNSIFDPRNGPLCDETTSGAISHALHVDSIAGDAMLQPFLKSEIARVMGDQNAFAKLTRDTPIDVPAESKTVPARHTTLGALLDRFAGGGTGETASSDDSDAGGGGGSNSGRTVEQVVSLSPDIVIATMPVVLTGEDFTDAWLEEQPASLLTPTSYTVHLGLTQEGRSRFFQWSHDHTNESLVFVLKHTVAMAGRIGQTLDVNEWGVTNIADKQAAQALVDYVNSEAHQRR